MADFHIGPLNLVELVILLIIVLDIYLEYMAFVRWRKGKAENQAEAVKTEDPNKETPK